MKMKYENPVVITRHQGFVSFLKKEGIIDGCRVMVHVTAEDVRGKVVIGNLPPHLAAEADLVVSPILNFEESDRGMDLCEQRFREIFGGFFKYRVEEVE